VYQIATKQLAFNPDFPSFIIFALAQQTLNDHPYNGKDSDNQAHAIQINNRAPLQQGIK